jgi:hypothetical protein
MLVPLMWSCCPSQEKNQIEASDVNIITIKPNERLDLVKHHEHYTGTLFVYTTDTVDNTVHVYEYYKGKIVTQHIIKK